MSFHAFSQSLSNYQCRRCGHEESSPGRSLCVLRLLCRRDCEIPLSERMRCTVAAQKGLREPFAFPCPQCWRFGRSQPPSLPLLLSDYTMQVLRFFISTDSSLKSGVAFDGIPRGDRDQPRLINLMVDQPEHLFWSSRCLTQERFTRPVQGCHRGVDFSRPSATDVFDDLSSELPVETPLSRGTAAVSFKLSSHSNLHSHLCGAGVVNFSWRSFAWN
ncbi:hypothetical protein EJ05DRAFT_174612 [Pseudovirgaria hyperparasitica]|uniref:Uncharacterized protein n=1 Tax=Pseudovirgaria hyperparasitica TaxID=470096 RepID=A0A6A6WIK6_9PEZI|nr:uncharacterized protein EJ05DRAFT_174612 [Pseudovirgaria hyperparasitica]KAF2761517.1 hypothetical protein EJ05DRAFT_174612 [Pseudovirgaria hyperparasitica]